MRKGEDIAALEGIYRQVIANDDEKATLAEAAKTPEGMRAFLAERDCAAAMAENLCADYEYAV